MADLNRIQRIIVHRNFSFSYVFVVVLCIVSLLFLPANHPIVPITLLAGVLMFILHRYRKKLLDR